LIGDGSPLTEANVQQQGLGALEFKDRETPIPSEKNYPSMVPRVPKKNRGRPKGILATKKSRRI